jgi:integrase
MKSARVLRSALVLKPACPVCEKHYLHRLRKACATRWLRNSINPMDIKTWLGHKSLAVTQLYLADSEHIDPGMQEKLDRAGKR